MAEPESAEKSKFDKRKGATIVSNEVEAPTSSSESEELLMESSEAEERSTSGPGTSSEVKDGSTAKSRRSKRSLESLLRSPKSPPAAKRPRPCSTVGAMTADMHRQLTLRVMDSGKRHQDLDTISADTLAGLLRGEHAGDIASFRVIDARYPYEFEGGHIRGAENYGAWDEAGFIREFLSMEKPARTGTSPEDGKWRRKILVFHCEFSSKRGPTLLRLLRNRDRSLNRDTYPALHYPEVYLLHNGYREFWERYPELCHPQGYTRMDERTFEVKEEEKKEEVCKKEGAGSVARRRLF